MTTAVIILNWNGQEMLRRFLPGLLENTSLPDTELWVADNASTDASREVVSCYPEVRWLQLDRNYGFAEGYNRAIRAIQADLVVLLNSDVEVTTGWLQPLVQELVLHRDVAAVQPKIRAYRNRPFFEHAGAAGGWLDKWGYPYCRGRMMDYVERDEGQYDSDIDVLWATGACLVTRRQVFLDNGGLDADFFAHMEEIDYCWRLRCRSWRVRCVAGSTVFHWGGASLSKENPLKTYLNFRNNLLMLFKNLPEGELQHVLRVRFVLDWAAAFNMLLHGKRGDFKAVCKARRDFRRMLPQFRLKRKENLERVTNPYPREIKDRSVVLDYYLRGKRV